MQVIYPDAVERHRPTHLPTNLAALPRQTRRLISKMEARHLEGHDDARPPSAPSQMHPPRRFGGEEDSCYVPGEATVCGARARL